LIAQDFIYQPQNPAFGGSYLNYSWLLSSAQAQNGFTAEENDISSRFDRDPLQDFEESVNRQVLNQISRRLFENQFGEEGLQEGQYEIGSYSINVTPSDEGIHITILDTSTGSTTTVSVPYF
jgi:curli production assembly/transport component CsgF